MPTDHRLSLPLGTVLQQYRLESVLGYGGFGIVYKARHQHLDRLVAIKEYLPQEIATRDSSTVHPLSSQEQTDFDYGLKRFLIEAKQLIRFDKHPNIVKCRDYFEFNGTAYLVMNFEDGLPLSDILKGREAKQQPLSEPQLLAIILPLLDGLSTLHNGDMLHRDIKPSNIFIRRNDEQPVLIDFGAAKQNFSEHSKSMAPYSPGYAAMEQIEEEGNLGPWTDIYGLGAVMWRMISGQNPPKVERRLNALVRGKDDPMASALELGKGKYSEQLLKGIDRCLKLREKERFQTIEELKQAIDRCLELREEDRYGSAGELAAALSGEASQEEPEEPQKQQKQQDSGEQTSKSVTPIKWVVGLVVLLLLIAGGFQYNEWTAQNEIARLADEYDVSEAAVIAAIEQAALQGTSAAEILQARIDTESEAERLAELERQRLEAERLVALEGQSLAVEYEVPVAVAIAAIEQAALQGTSPEEILQARVDAELEAEAQRVETERLAEVERQRVETERLAEVERQRVETERLAELERLATLEAERLRWGEECSLDAGFCFGIIWETATPADVADVDINARDEDGWTPLHWAAWNSETPAVIQALLTAGAEINARSKNGWTPLQLAARHSETPAVIQALLTAGAEINARDVFGRTPLHWAAEYSATPAVIITLLNHGANPKLKTNDGYIAFDYAQLNDKIKNTEAYWALNDAR